MIRYAKVTVSFVPQGEKENGSTWQRRTAKQVPLDSRYVYAAVEGIHWDQRDNDPNSPTFNVIKGNDNGDYFERDELLKVLDETAHKAAKANVKYAYQTWDGKPIRLNHKVGTECGFIADTFPDTKHSAILMLSATDKEKEPKLCERIASGRQKEASMAVDIRESECTRCGKITYSEKDWCECLKKHKGHIHPADGKRVAEICRGLTGVELSWITEGAPADKAALAQTVYAVEENQMSRSAGKSPKPKTKVVGHTPKITDGDEPARSDRTIEAQRAPGHVGTLEEEIRREVAAEKHAAKDDPKPEELFSASDEDEAPEDEAPPEKEKKEKKPPKDEAPEVEPEDEEESETPEKEESEPEAKQDEEKPADEPKPEGSESTDDLTRLVEDAEQAAESAQDAADAAEEEAKKIRNFVKQVTPILDKVKSLDPEAHKLLVEQIDKICPDGEHCPSNEDRDVPMETALNPEPIPTNLDSSVPGSAAVPEAEGNPLGDVSPQPSSPVPDNPPEQRNAPPALRGEAAQRTVTAVLHEVTPRTASHWTVSIGSTPAFDVSVSQAYPNDELELYPRFASKEYGRELVARVQKDGIDAVITKAYGGRVTRIAQAQPMSAPPPVVEQNTEQPPADQNVVDLVIEVLAPIVASHPDWTPENVLDDLASGFGDPEGIEKLKGQLAEKVKECKEESKTPDAPATPQQPQATPPAPTQNPPVTQPATPQPASTTAAASRKNAKEDAKLNDLLKQNAELLKRVTALETEKSARLRVARLRSIAKRCVTAKLIEAEKEDRLVEVMLKRDEPTLKQIEKELMAAEAKQGRKAALLGGLPPVLTSMPQVEATETEAQYQFSGAPQGYLDRKAAGERV